MRPLKKSLEPIASSFPHSSTPVEWMAGIQSHTYRQAVMLMFWIPGSALRPRNDDPVGVTDFFNNHFSRWILYTLDVQSSTFLPDRFI